MIKKKNDYYKYNFQEQKLEIDYLAFNKQFRNNSDLINDILTISDYLDINFYFNSFLIWEKKPHRPIRQNRNSNYKVIFIFRQEDKYNKVLTISFSGKNAAYFYQLIKSEKINWNIFDLNYISLGRIDICHFRENKLSDIEYVYNFLQECCNYINAHNETIKTKIVTNQNGPILAIGNRSSQSYYRIYTREDGIRFELEIKKGKVYQYQSFLFLSAFEEFEDALTQEFYKYSNRFLVIESCFTDWLRNYNRQNKNLYKSNQFLVTSYIDKMKILKISKSESLNQMKQFQFLLQFLTFTSQLEAKRIDNIKDQEYHLLEFFLIDFLKFLGNSNLSVGQTNYQRDKIKEFFNELQNNAPFIEHFSQKSFRRAISIPYYDLIKTGRTYIVEVAVAPELYYQKYLFKLPPTFLFYDDTYDLRIKSEIISSLAQSEIQKQFPVKQFLDQFKVSNAKKTYIKSKIIELFFELQNKQVIQPNYKLIYTDNHLKYLDSFNDFNREDFTQLHFIYFYENIT